AQQLCREAIIWQYLAHQNILPFLGVECDLYPNQWCLVSLWMDNKDIVRYLRGRQPPADIHVLYEVAQGLAYLHWENLVHGDLKGMNILIDEHHHVRLADFGLSTFAETTRGANATTSSGPRGSMPFMAPELHNPTKFGFDHFQRTRSTDIYAFGCVCYEIYTGYSPWYKELGNNEGAIINAVMNGMQPSRPSPDECSGKRIDDELWKLMQRCWAPYYDRPDIRTIAHIFARKQQPMVRSLLL
ncbi:kinase-like protein, partial [Gloeophyllum trabeum ATCC 11539]